MTAPSNRATSRADVLAQADEALAQAAEHYITLSDPDWKAAGSTSTGPPTDRRPTRVHPDLPINVDVLDFLALAETELADLASEVLGATGGHDATGDREPDTTWTTVEAFHVLRRRLPHLPDAIAAEVAAAAWRMARAGGRLLGASAPGQARHRCGFCGRRSLIAHPTERGWLVCSSRACRALVSTAVDPSPPHE